jgi:hypothetical protein
MLMGIRIAWGSAGEINTFIAIERYYKRRRLSSDLGQDELPVDGGIL